MIILYGLGLAAVLMIIYLKFIATEFTEKQEKIVVGSLIVVLSIVMVLSIQAIFESSNQYTL
jgi:hypothetical protein